MEFKSLKNIETSFKHIRLYVMVFAGLFLPLPYLPPSHLQGNRERRYMYLITVNRLYWHWHRMRQPTVRLKQENT